MVRRGWGRRPQKGLVLTGWLAYMDDHNRLWLGRPGSAWNGADYPNWLRKLVGDRNAESVEASSYFHDRMDEVTEVYLMDDTQREAVIKLFEHAHPYAIIDRVLQEVSIAHIPIGIFEGAIIYKQMIGAHEDDVGWFRRKLQKIGLWIFQPWVRLWQNSGSARWEEVKETEL